MADPAREALPEEKIARDPWLKRMFLGYAFSIDYRDRRGHAYMLSDQEATKRLTKPQTGSCLHCHASVRPLYRELGKGDTAKGLAESYKFSYQDPNKKLHDSGHAHPVSCVDCQAAAQGAVAARHHRGGELDGLPCPAGGRDGLGRSPRLRTPGGTCRDPLAERAEEVAARRPASRMHRDCPA
ncbi:MAG TPA: ammonia-forming cytochrome c nitrite reductase subunit c552 [Burkholderiales bacterium]|nr:ammonia-forming cytochrome c nitrite reductase subunit c552 [Burkholderiales bacterium]